MSSTSTTTTEVVRVVAGGGDISPSLFTTTNLLQNLAWVGTGAIIGLGAATLVAKWVSKPKVQASFTIEPRTATAAAAAAAAAAPSAAPPRDMSGYGPNLPKTRWPDGALLALNFVINVEEGSEPSIPDGDANSCASLCECGSDAPPGVRDLAAEGMFEYGSRVGFWRVLRLFEEYSAPATAFVCALALERLPLVAAALRQSGFDFCCHGWRWEDHIDLPLEVERDRIARAVRSMRDTLGTAPKGWYCRTAPSVHTRRLLVEHGGFIYDSDAYNDDLPYWVSVPCSRSSTSDGNDGSSSSGDDGTIEKKEKMDYNSKENEKKDGRHDAAAAAAVVKHHHLVIPYTLCTNDSKFAPGRAFSTSEDFATFMIDAIDHLVAEARATDRPRMMSIGLHPRLIGHAARIGGLRKVLEHVRKLGNDVWLCRREEIAAHWRTFHPPPIPRSTFEPLPTAALPQPPPQPHHCPSPSSSSSSSPSSSSSSSSLSSSSPSSLPPPSSSSSSPNLSNYYPRLLITGGAGFVLANVVEHWLASDPKATAVIFDLERCWDAPVASLLARFARERRLAYFAGSVACEADWARLERVHGTAFTHIVSGAAITPTLKEEHAASVGLLEVNLHGHLRTLTFAQKCQNLHRLVHVSSDAVLGVDGLLASGRGGDIAASDSSAAANASTGAATTAAPAAAAAAAAAAKPNRVVGRQQCQKQQQQKEEQHKQHEQQQESEHCYYDRALPPMSLYALAKVGGEVATRRWATLHGLSAVSVRFSDVYGRLDRDTGARNRHNGPYWLCRRLISGSRVAVLGSSLDEPGWDIIDVESVARGVVSLLTAQDTPKLPVYHLGLGRAPCHREVLAAAMLGLKRKKDDERGEEARNGEGTGGPEGEQEEEVAGEASICSSPMPPEAQNAGHDSSTGLVLSATTSNDEFQVEFVTPGADDAAFEAAVTGRVQLMSLPLDHWLLKTPLDVTPMMTEFGWQASPLQVALPAYVRHLVCKEK